LAVAATQAATFKLDEIARANTQFFLIKRTSPDQSTRSRWSPSDSRSKVRSLGSSFSQARPRAAADALQGRRSIYPQRLDPAADGALGLGANGKLLGTVMRTSNSSCIACSAGDMVVGEPVPTKKAWSTSGLQREPSHTGRAIAARLHDTTKTRLRRLRRDYLLDTRNLCDQSAFKWCQSSLVTACNRCRRALT
jgi:hypothetical protein